MENLEQENRELHKEVTALKASMANLTTLMESLVVAQNHPPLAQPQQIMVTSESDSSNFRYSSYCGSESHASGLPVEDS